MNPLVTEHKLSVGTTKEFEGVRQSLEPKS
jgi:hypothetical protein